MKEEIERILNDESTHDIVAGFEFAYKHDFGQIATNLQKLFLTKQIELLEEVMIPGAVISGVKAKREQLQSELKQLQ